MIKPERASRLWLVLAIVMQKAMLLGGELEAKEQEARAKTRWCGGGKKRRPGRPALPKRLSEGTRAECVIMRDDGHAGRRVRRQDSPESLVGENGASAHTAVSGKQGAQKLSVEETTPRGKEARPATRQDERKEN